MDCQDSKESDESDLAERPWFGRSPGWGRQTNWAAARDLRLRQTPAEATLWELLRNNAFGMRFRRQHPIGPFIVDFYCPEAGLIIELDGDVHDEIDVKEQDMWRQEWLEQHGFVIVRFRNEDILLHRATAVEKIRCNLANRK